MQDIQAVQNQTDRSSSRPKSQAVSKTSEKSKKTAMASIRVRKEAKKSLEATLSKLNQKDYGRKVRADEVLSLALSLITQQHLTQLQESALTHADRLERDYRAYVSKSGPISRDEYLGGRLSGQIQDPSATPATAHALADPSPTSSGGGAKGVAGSEALGGGVLASPRHPSVTDARPQIRHSNLRSGGAAAPAAGESLTPQIRVGHSNLRSEGASQ